MSDSSSSQLDRFSPSRELHAGLRGYTRAMERATGGWKGSSLKRRRQQLRRLADSCGKRDQLEVVLEALRTQGTETAPAAQPTPVR